MGVYAMLWGACAIADARLCDAECAQNDATTYFVSQAAAKCDCDDLDYIRMRSAQLYYIIIYAEPTSSGKSSHRVQRQDAR